MRPEILKLQAFGPYVKQQCINFHVFDEQHLFLIQGETGSGKTMLLDAMTYALYGKSSGSQREDLYSMRSRFAEARKNGFEHVDISRILRKPFFVLESKNIDDLFREMQSKHQHIAILIDEYGGFSGIVTMEDLVEEIMGDIEDEYDEDDEAQIEKLDEHTYVLDGGMPIDDINEELGLQLENDNHETISGFLLDLIGQIPEDGEEREVIWNHIKFQVKEVKYKRIHKVQLVLMQEEGNSEEV